MSVEEEIKILENALSGALLVPSECAFVSTEIIKICLETLKTYESWEDLIKWETEKQIRADAIDEYFEIIKKHEDMLGCVMICQCESIAEQLKEKNNEYK